MTQTDTKQAIQDIMESLSENIEFDQLVNKLVDKDIITPDEVTRLNMKDGNDRTQELLVTLLDKESSSHPLILSILETLKTPSPENTRRADQAIEQAAGSTRDSSTGSRAVCKTEKRILNNTDVSKDWDLKNFLYELSKEIDTHDLEDMKDLMRGETGFKQNIVSKIGRPMTFFQQLMKTRRLNAYNLHFLQALIRRIGRLDLNERVRQFCLESNKNPIHFFTPSEKPENGYRYVRHHIDGDIDKLDHMEKERLRVDVATALCVPLEFVYITGIEPTASFLITFMVPEEDVKSFIQIYVKEGPSSFHLSIYIHIEGDELSFSESPPTSASNPTKIFQELKHLLEREQTLEGQLADRDEQLMELQEKLEHREGDTTLYQHPTGPGLRLNELICFQMIQLVIKPLDDVLGKLAAMTIDLTRKERRKLRKSLCFSDAEKEQLKNDYTKLLELAVMKEYPSGTQENILLNDVLKEILGKIKKSHMVDKYFTTQESVRHLPAESKAVQTQLVDEAEKGETAVGILRKLHSF